MEKLNRFPVFPSSWRQGGNFRYKINIPYRFKLN
jgi:hypothetical protein